MTDQADFKIFRAKCAQACKFLKLSEMDYRLLLVTEFGAMSSKALNEKERARLLGIFEDRGWRQFHKTKQLSGAPKFKPECAAMGRKVAAMLSQASRTWDYAHGTAKRMFSVDRVEWLNATQLHALTSALAIDQKRRARKPQNLPTGAA